MGSCPSQGRQQRFFLGHLATGCPTKMLRQLKTSIPLGSSTRTNGTWNRINAWLDGGTPEQSGNSNNLVKQHYELGAVQDTTMLDPYSSLPTLKLKILVRLPTKKDREFQVKG